MYFYFLFQYMNQRNIFCTLLKKHSNCELNLLTNKYKYKEHNYICIFIVPLMTNKRSSDPV